MQILRLLHRRFGQQHGALHARSIGSRLAAALREVAPRLRIAHLSQLWTLWPVPTASTRNLSTRNCKRLRLWALRAARPHARRMAAATS